MILGEAVKRLSDEFREAHDHIPWTDAARMRDRLIYGYDAIDLDIVWQAAPPRSTRCSRSNHAPRSRTARMTA